MRRILLLLIFVLSCSLQDKDLKEASEVLPEIEVEDANINPARCSFEDCLCAVKIPKYTPKYQTVVRKSYTSVYFAENQGTLTPDGKETIRLFIKDRLGVQSILVLGYTDGCGSYAFNKNLSSLRSYTVAKFLVLKGYRGRIITAGMSEITAGHSDLAKRSDIITSEDFRFQVPPPNLVADYYLLDASGSVRNYKDWVNIIAANKKSTSKLYISYTLACSDEILATNITPAGATEIWWSYWQVLDKMKTGQTLILLSDFNSRYPLSDRESFLLQEKATKKGVTVYAVQL